VVVVEGPTVNMVAVGNSDVPEGSAVGNMVRDYRG
jgi:hypothetical protein